MKTLKVSDSKNGFLSFDLRDFLELIEEGDKFHWNLKEINFSVLSSNNKKIKDENFNLLELIMDTKNYEISWEELLRLSNFNIQIIDGEIIGKYDGNSIIIKAFDSSYWTVQTNITSLIDKIIGKFSDVSL